MDGIINFSEFFKKIDKKELPKFDKEEILNDFYVNEYEEIDSTQNDREESSNTNIEDSDEMYSIDDDRYDDLLSEPTTYNRDEVEKMIQTEIAKIKKETISEYSKINENKESDYDDKIIESSSSDFYKLYADKAETFSCEIELEGANLKDTEVRLVIESDNWNLMFPGEIDRNGKVSIPIKKLNILEEGTRGKIKMEVIAEGTVFTPWEDDFEIKLSKKVMVKFNENKQSKQVVKKPGVKVNFKK
jgi:hypothetical protein